MNFFPIVNIPLEHLQVVFVGVFHLLSGIIRRASGDDSKMD